MGFRTVVFALLATLLFACSGDDELVDANGDGIDDRVVAPNNVTVVTPTTPLGYVGGEIHSAVDGSPIAGVEVTLVGGGIDAQATTDDRGVFEVGPIAAGAAFVVHLKAAGFIDAEIGPTEIDDDAGNFPTANAALFIGVSLIPAGGSFAVQVVSASGDAVANATVTIESAVSAIAEGFADRPLVVTGTTNTDGLAVVDGLPDFKRLPAQFEHNSGLTITVAAVDLDGDGRADLAGETIFVPGADVRSGAATPIIVLDAPRAERFEIVASNIPRLLSTSSGPAVLDANENIRIVVNAPINREGVLVDLRDETGASSIPAPFVVGVTGNTLSIDPAEDLEPGKEYNIAVRIPSSSLASTEVLTVAAPFFARVNPQVMVTVTGAFLDRNVNGAWGDAGDVLALTASIPLGVATRGSFAIKAWFDLDLNNDGVIGNAQGELPPAGASYPAPLLVSSQEPDPGNGAGTSGLTRVFAPIAVSLVSPRSSIQGGVAFEVQISAQDNGGTFVTDVSGRAAPERITGTAVLQ
jgi:hypothetical protein